MIKRLSEEDIKIIRSIYQRPNKFLSTILFSLFMLVLLLVCYFITNSQIIVYEITYAELTKIFSFILIIYVGLYLYLYFNLKCSQLKEDEMLGVKHIENVFIVSYEKKRQEKLFRLSNNLSILDSDLFIFHDLCFDEDITSQTPLEIEYLPKSKHILSIRKL